MKIWGNKTQGNPVRVAIFLAEKGIEIGESAALDRTKLLEALDMMDAQLRDNRFVAVADFTVADITAILPFQILGLLEIKLPDHNRSVARWHEEVPARPSVASVIGGYTKFGGS